jgi:hypothetical protein
MAALARVAAAVSRSLSDIYPAGGLAKLAHDDGSVVATFETGDGARVGVTIVYADPSAYPACGALIMPDGGPTERLEALAERFQDRAPLTAVLAKVRCLFACFWSCCVLYEGGRAWHGVHAVFMRI